MSKDFSRWVGRRGWTAVLTAALFALGGVGSASPAWADEPGETTVGYQLVQQALAHLAHDSSMAGMTVAMEKIEDALATKDQEGVNVGELEQAAAAMESGQVQQGQALLQKSITEALHNLPPVVGDETGTTQVLNTLPGRPMQTSNDWGFLTASVLLLLVGAALAARYRPRDNVRALRSLLGPPLPRTDRRTRHTTKDA